MEFCHNRMKWWWRSRWTANIIHLWRDWKHWWIDVSSLMTGNMSGCTIPPTPLLFQCNWCVSRMKPEGRNVDLIRFNRYPYMISTSLQHMGSNMLPYNILQYSVRVTSFLMSLTASQLNLSIYKRCDLQLITAFNYRGLNVSLGLKEPCHICPFSWLIPVCSHEWGGLPHTPELLMVFFMDLYLGSYFSR